MSKRSAPTPFAVEVTNLTKRFRRQPRLSPNETLKGFLVNSIFNRRRGDHREFLAVHDVSFKVSAGETVGIIGSNGSGKSTTLKMLAGLLKPSSGSITIDGRVSALIELGSGFHPEISGRENVFIAGVMLGLTKQQVAERYDAIVDFAGLREFMEEPVKHYSSGMFMRLGFSVAVHVTPEVLLIDEVLAVGDQEFVSQCYDKLAEFKRQNKTIIMVSHDLHSVQMLCDRLLWLEKGRLREDGFPRRVVDAYLEDVHRREEARLAQEDVDEQALVTSDMAANPDRLQTPAESLPEGLSETASFAKDRGFDVATSGDDATSLGALLQSQHDAEHVERWGNKQVVFTGLSLKNHEGKETHVFNHGDRLTLEMSYEARMTTEDVVFGIGLFTASDVPLFGTNTQLDLEPKTLPKGRGTLSFTIPKLPLLEGSYLLDIAVHAKDGHPYDYVRRVRKIFVHSEELGVGVLRPECWWEFGS